MILQNVPRHLVVSTQKKKMEALHMFVFFQTSGLGSLLAAFISVSISDLMNSAYSRYVGICYSINSFSDSLERKYVKYCIVEQRTYIFNIVKKSNLILK